MQWCLFSTLPPRGWLAHSWSLIPCPFPVPACLEPLTDQPHWQCAGLLSTSALVAFKDDSQANPMDCSFKGHICSLPLRKRELELFLRLLRHKTNIVSHYDSGEHQRVGAWKVEWVPSGKENFLVQKGAGSYRRPPGMGKLGLDISHALDLQRNRVPSIFHIQMSLQEWLWADRLQNDGLSSSPRASQDGRVAPEYFLLLEFLFREV